MEVTYDPSENYVKLHLEWIRANDKFKPKGGLDKVINGLPAFSSYYEQMVHYYHNSAPEYRNKVAMYWLRDDVKWKAGGPKDINKLVNEMFGITKKEEYPAFFVTFNFDESKFKPKEVLNDLGKFMSLSWIHSVQGAFEYYTEHGHHPHLMMVITITNKPNKTKERMLESRLAKYCGGSNFIEVKRAKDYHNDYVLLSKTKSKQEYLEKDELWRIENNLPHEIKK